MNLELRDTPGRGRGVFALARFSPGQCIEEAPVLVYPAGYRELISRTSLADYPYDWFDGAEALVMGLGSFYNHSYRPNARYERNRDRRTISYVALRTIEAGEEITVNYNGAPDDQSPVWFPVHD